MNKNNMFFTHNENDNPFRTLFECILNANEEYYKTELSRKIAAGKKTNAHKCIFNGGVTPFGYIINSNGRYEIDPETAPIVLEIFSRYANGQELSEILTAVQSRYTIWNISTENANKKRIYRLLTNRRYIGEYRYRDIVIPNGIPSIVPYDLFSKVQNRIENYKQKGEKRK